MGVEKAEKKILDRVSSVRWFPHLMGRKKTEFLIGQIHRKRKDQENQEKEIYVIL